MTGQIEEWRAVTGYEGFYEVSSHGRVRSLDREIARQNRWGGMTVRLDRGRMLAPKINKAGYPVVPLSREGTVWRVGVHIIVCTAFNGPRGNGMQVAHGDGDPSNARAANLRWATPHENSADKAIHGTALIGELNPRALVTPDQVREIRAIRGMTQRAIASAYKISPSQVRNIQHGDSWKSVETDDCSPRKAARVLTIEQVREIRAITGMSQKAIGQKFQISQSHVGLIQRREIWKED